MLPGRFLIDFGSGTSLGFERTSGRKGGSSQTLEDQDRATERSLEFLKFSCASIVQAIVFGQHANPGSGFHRASVYVCVRVDLCCCVWVRGGFRRLRGF